jgi:predicted site-specific integrase-resolvase
MQVARFFRISRSTVYRWCDEGILLPCSPTPGTVRIFRTSILDAMKKAIR